MSMLESVAQKFGFSTNTPLKNLSKEQLDIVLYGSGGQQLTMKHETQLGKMYEYDTQFEGVIRNLERRFKDTESDYIRSEIERYMMSRPCPSCNGLRLKPEALAVTIVGKNVAQVSAMFVDEAIRWVESLTGDGKANPAII